MKNIFFITGRICISLLFILTAAHYSFNWEAVLQNFNHNLLDVINKPALPYELYKIFNFILSYASLIFALLTFCSGFGGLLVLLGINVRIGAILLIIFLISQTFIFHSWWLYDPSNRELQLSNFLKNISLLGGLFVLATSIGKGS